MIASKKRFAGRPIMAQTLNAGLIDFLIFSGDTHQFCQETYCYMILGGFLIPDPSPSGSAHGPDRQ